MDVYLVIYSKFARATLLQPHIIIVIWIHINTQLTTYIHAQSAKENQSTFFSLRYPCTNTISQSKPDFINQTGLSSHFHCSWMIDLVETGTDTAVHSFHQLVAVVASGTSRMMTSSYHRHIVAGSWVCFPSNLNEPEKYLAGAYRKVLQSWKKSVRILHLLTHRTPIPRIWYH